jgi:hypothetical protein
MSKKLIAGLGSIALIAVFALNSLLVGATGASRSSRVVSGKLIRGAVGGDFDTQLPVGSVNGADWGVDQQFRIPAGNLIHDGNVFINIDNWTDAGGQLAPTTTDDSAECDGTALHPTAPPGDVCIYVLGSDNAVNLSGYAIEVGTGGSRFGFKLKWDAAGNGDTYVDAVYAYRFP